MSVILRTVLSISAASAFSRLTGYARTMVQAAVLGTGLVANAYAVSSLLPNLIYGLFLGGIIYSIFIPILVERITSHGEEDARRLVNALATLILPLLAVVVLLAIVFAEPLVSLTTSWTGSEKLSPKAARELESLTVLFFRIFVVQIFFWGIGALATGILNSHRRFFLPLFTPSVFNLFVISSFGGYVLLVPERPDVALFLLAGVPTLGVILVTLALLPAVFRLGYKPRPRINHPALLPALRLAGPMLVFVAASVGLQLCANFFATRFNAAAELGYAFVIFSLPYGIFAVAIATALMPELSERYAQGDTEGYRTTLSFGLRTMAFIMVPASVVLIVFSRPIVSLLYERGNFDAQATQTVAAILVAYSVGLLGYAAYFLLIQAFYSRKNTKTPALLNIGLLVLYAGLTYGLSHSFGVFGVALALSGTNAVLALICLAATRKELKRIGGVRLLRSLVKILVAGAAMYTVARIGTTLLDFGTGFLRALVLTGVGGASLAAYLGVALALKTEELKSAVTLLGRRRVTGAEE